MSEVERSHQDINQVRGQIDDIDSQIIDLLAQRSECVEQIAAIKCNDKLAIYDSSRENRIIEKVTKANPTRYQAVDMASIFHAILRAGLNQQLLYRSEHEE